MIVGGRDEHLLFSGPRVAAVPGPSGGSVQRWNRKAAGRVPRCSAAVRGEYAAERAVTKFFLGGGLRSAEARW